MIYQFSLIYRSVSYLTILTALVVMYGWLRGIELVQIIVQSWPSMKFNTALCFFLLGGVLLCTLYRKKLFKILLGGVLLFVASISFIENLTDLEVGLDVLLVPGLMSAGTALCFALMGLAHLVIYADSVEWRKMSQYLLHSVTVISFFAMIGFVYGISGEGKLMFISSMAIHTSALFFLSSIASSLIHPSLGFTALLIGKKPGNLLAKRMFPLMGSLILVLGYLVIKYWETGEISPETGLTLFGMSILIIALTFISMIAMELNRTDIKRSEAVRALRDSNANLEKTVAERTALLKDKMELLNATTSAARIGTWEVDLEAGKVTWSEMTREIHEVPIDFEPDLTTGINFFKEGAHRSRIEATVQECIATGKPYDVELMIVTATGEDRWIRAIGTPILRDDKVIRLRGTFQDIDVRKRAEIKISEESIFLQTLIDNIPINIYTKDLLSRKTMINRSELELMGLDNSSTVIGKTDHELFPKESADISRKEDVEVMKTGIPILSRETSMDLGENNKHWFLTSKIPIKNSEGNVTGLLGVSVDITERKENEEKLKNYAILESKSAEMEQFAYVASHDLREPVLTIKNYLNILFEDYGEKLGEGSKRYSNTILNALNRMELLIGGLLDYARLSRQKSLEQVDLNEAVKNVLESLDSLIVNSQATVKVSKLPRIKGYPIEIELLFQNLITNGIKFHHPDRLPVVEIERKKYGSGWMFLVRDNGIGIEPEYIEEVFVMFKRLHSRRLYEGTGIGLSHCRKIVELHNGKIWVESEPGIGSVFYFTIDINE
ncbi:ATP-binding protein [Marinoscillum sp. 108]|uniref:sensor histidine kinase n=1 Tax=Marinoscillum sp. 108 TaxID=2653151 RepID=UPI0012F03D93|nr:PAS domain-containing sensor histidine kinase [Marinoscillum sp. 108]VXD10340.1 PAS domain S-box-containing protein [Marinoscillum sp. 108]